MIVSLNLDRCRSLGLLLRKIRFSPDPFINAKFYPSTKLSLDLIANYFFFMVAIDHRTSYEDIAFEGLIGGEKYSGAQLLWRLGKVKLDADPEFFTVDRMKRIRASDVAEWLRVENPYPREVWDPDVRAFLLRDAALKLSKYYEGSVLNLIKASGGFLFKDGGGFIERLRAFKAYEDPVGKKAFLLVKFLERRAILKVLDEDRLEVPVDNHLSRIALRLGLVRVDNETLSKIREGREFTYAEDYALRSRVKEAFKLVAAFSNIKPTILDDFLWLLGKTCCTRDRPVCVYGCDKAVCPLKDLIGTCYEMCILTPVCRARSDVKLQLLPEHNFTKTWYY